MVFANEQGEVLDDPSVEMAGMSGREPVRVQERDLIPLPHGSELLALPDRCPIGFERRSPRGRQRLFGDRRAVAAFLAPAYTRFLGPAMERSPGGVLLPLYAYAAVGWRDGRFWVPAVRVDPDPRQDPKGFDLQALPEVVERHMAVSPPANRLIEQLKGCALDRCCPAARNYFLARSEAPLPTSPWCNARCIGCISEQPEARTPTFGRIAFLPGPEEVAQVAIPHLEKVPDPVVSFGQGCEGEPLLVADLLEESLRLIRGATNAGVVNLNTNGSRPDQVARLCQAGLDSVRVSLPSALPSLFDAYTKPMGFGLQDVIQSLGAAREAGAHTSINYFVFPGVSDLQAEVEALIKLCGSGLVDMVQLRNLNIDPDLYLSELGPLQDLGPAISVAELIRRLRSELPDLRLGYFNPCWPRDSP